MPERPHVAIMLDLEWSFKHHTAIFAGAMQFAEEHGWLTTIDEYVGDTLPARRARKPGRTKLPYDGVIARADQKTADRASRLDLPIVNVWYNSPAFDELPGVYVDQKAVGMLAAEHLQGRGFRQFAALTAVEDRGQAQATEAFASAAQQIGSTCVIGRCSLHPRDTLALWRKTERALASWMDGWELPVGVFVAADHLSQIVVQMCRQRDWRIPQDVAVVVGKNEETYCENTRPTLTGIEIGYERIGYEAARLLDERMSQRREQPASGSKTSPAEPESAPQKVILPPRGLVLRESTDFYTAGDPEVAQALAFIAQNSHRPIRVDDVAEAVMLEPRTLRRRFDKHLGWPVVDEIRRVRIERAKRELMQGDASIADIAHAVGFSDANRLYEVFVREVGVSPTQYRKERQLEHGGPS